MHSIAAPPDTIDRKRQERNAQPRHKHFNTPRSRKRIAITGIFTNHSTNRTTATKRIRNTEHKESVDRPPTGTKIKLISSFWRPHTPAIIRRGRTISAPRHSTKKACPVQLFAKCHTGGDIAGFARRMVVLPPLIFSPFHPAHTQPKP